MARFAKAEETYFATVCARLQELGHHRERTLDDRQGHEGCR